jgi:dynein heavy chain
LSQAEFIGELSANANKELSIEVSLDSIKGRWQDVAIDVVEYKDVYHKIRSTEDLYQVRIAEHGGSLKMEGRGA